MIKPVRSLSQAAPVPIKKDPVSQNITNNIITTLSDRSEFSLNLLPPTILASKKKNAETTFSPLMKYKQNIYELKASRKPKIIFGIEIKLKFLTSFVLFLSKKLSLASEDPLDPWNDPIDQRNNILETKNKNTELSEPSVKTLYH